MKTLLQFTIILLYLFSQSLFAQSGTVYFGASDGKLYALDVSTGVKKWEYTVYYEPLTNGGRIVVPPPAIVDGVLYGMQIKGNINSNFLIALDASTGAKKWEIKVTQTSPFYDLVVANNIVYVSSKYGIVAFDAKTGIKKWERNDIWAVASPTVFNGFIYINTLLNNSICRLVALDAQTGTRKWEFDNCTDVNPAISVSNKIIYISGRNIDQTKFLFHAIDAQTGVKKWEFEPPIQKGTFTNPIVLNQTVHFGLSVFYALDAQTGAKKWSSDIGTNAFLDFSGNDGPVADNGNIYVESSNIYELNGNLGSSKLMWDNYKTKSFMHLGVVANGILYGIGADDNQNNQIYALDTKTSTIKWRFLLGDIGVYYTVVVDNNGKGYYPSSSGMDSEPSTITLTLSQETKNIAQGGETSTLNLTTDNTWTASSNSTWLKVSPTSGNAGTNIAVNYTVDANTTTDTRTGIITFTAGGLTKTFTVTQAGKTTGQETLTLSADRKSITSVSQTDKLTITATNSWTATSNVSWLKVSPTSGNAGTNITVNYSADAYTVVDGDTRVGVITFTSGATTKTFTIRQANNKASYLDISQVSKYVSAVGVGYPLNGLNDDNYFSVQSNHDWNVTVNVDWLKISQSSRNVNGGATTDNISMYYTVDENTSTNQRVGVITFVMVGGLSKTLTITQGGKTAIPEVLTINPAITLNLLSDLSHNDYFMLTSSDDWTATSNSTWLSVLPSSGKAGTNTIINYIVDANNSSFSNRTGVITFKKGLLTRTFTVFQDSKRTNPNILTISEPIKALKEERQSDKTTITTNDTWTAKTNDSWLSISPNSGVAGTNIIVNYTVEANTSTIKRRGSITFTSSSGGGNKTFIIEQGGKTTVQPILTVIPNVGGTTPSMGEVFKTTVTANNDWTASADVEWITISPNQGGAVTNIDVVVSVNANTTTSSRIGNVTFTSGGLTKSFTISQAGKVASTDILTVELGGTYGVSNDVYDFEWKGQKDNDIKISANNTWKITTDVSWIQLSPVSGNAGTNSIVKYTIEANNSRVARIGTITVTAGTLSKKIYIQQYPIYFILTPESTNINSNGKSDKISLTAYDKWTSKTIDSWINLSTLSGNIGSNIQVPYTVSSNLSNKSRIGFIFFFPQSGGSGSAFIIKQGSLLPKLSLSTYLLKINNAAITGTIKLTSNVSWYIETDVPWIKSIQPASGNSGIDILINYSVDANTSNSQRDGYLTVIAAYEDADGGINYVNERFLIRQEALILGSNSEPLNESSINIYPNPSPDKINISLHYEKPQIVTINLTDNLGRSLRNWQLNTPQTKHELTVDISSFSSGSYFISTESNGVKTVKKVVKD